MKKLDCSLEKLGQKIAYHEKKVCDLSYVRPKACQILIWRIAYCTEYLEGVTIRHTVVNPGEDLRQVGIREHQADIP